jgi:hypothetical protein
MKTAKPAAPLSRAENYVLIALVMAQLVIFLIPLIVLGNAIGWPASLRLPAAEALPLIAREALAVQVGYWGYLVTSIALVPLALAMRQYAMRSGMSGLLVDSAAAIGVASGVLKTLGIVRWLIAMPTLASLYQTSTDPVVRTAVEVSYRALNGYAGSVGELLGVQLFSGMWLLFTGIVIFRLGFRVTGPYAAVIGALFALTALRTIFPALETLQAILPPAALIWFPAFAFVLWRRG